MTQAISDGDAARLERNFVAHAIDGGQKERCTEIRSWAKELALAVMERVPESRERSIALTKIEEAVMWAIAGIARPEAE